jgi:hypothetical protein
MYIEGLRIDKLPRFEESFDKRNLYEYELRKDNLSRY